MQRLLAALAPRARLAIVYVQHLDPQHESFLVPLLANKTRLVVVEASDGVRVAPGHVYVAPPHTAVSLHEGVLRLAQPTERSGAARTVDAWFTSLAADRGQDAVAVVLSGNGSDGTAGITAIKAAGGLTLAQVPDTAKFDGMPASAVATGMVDFVSSAEEIGARLKQLVRSPRARAAAKANQRGAVALPAPEPSSDPLDAILHRLRVETGIDFDSYKRATVQRRILRRMGLRGIPTLEAYAKVLRDHRDAVAELHQDLLIQVTSFFRDAETFRVVERRVLPLLLENRAPNDPIRVWVPGCATGEEAYSIAMCVLDAVGDRHPLQLFATDVREDAIAHARAGVYSAAALKPVGAERRARFFRRIEGGSFQVYKRIRDACVFACHDLTRDPPFSRLDLISCRNVLIYFQAALQRRLIRLFHYALLPGGCLVLGAAEAAGAPDLFAQYGGKQRKIYLRSPTPAGRHRDRQPLAVPSHDRRRAAGRTPAISPGSDLAHEADRVLLARFAPPSVLVDDHLEVVQFRGDTSAHLEHRAGGATLALLKMVREDLALDLRAALDLARKKGVAARVGGVRRDLPHGRFETAVEVVPLGSAKPGSGFLVMFHDTPVPADAAAADAVASSRRGTPRVAADAGRVRQLQTELRATRTHLSATIQEHEAMTEELRAAMEEVTSASEEQQSINEELETAKEELQSTNEELTTVNDELLLRNSEINQVNVDLHNLLASVDMPIVMLGRDLTIRRFTTAAEPMFHLIAGDIGRPLVDLRSNLDLPDLRPLLDDVIASGKAVQRELRAPDGGAYSMWVRPYVTTEGACDGAVITLFDVSERKRAEEALRLYAERLHLLGEIDSAVLAGGNLSTVARLALPRIRRFLAAAHAGVLLLDQDRTEATILVEDHDRQVDAPAETSVRDVIRDGNGGLPLTASENLCVSDLAVVTPRRAWLQRFAEDGMRSLLSVPLAVDGRVIGRLFAAAPQPRAFGDAHVQLARDVADHLAVAIEQARLYEQVRAARQRLAGLASHLVAAQEAERRRVAKELHDEVGQVLTGLRLSLGDIASKHPAVDVAAGIAQVDHLIAAVRTMSLDLRPTVLDDLGLLPALLTHNERFTALTGVNVHLEHQGVDRRFAPDVETAAYRIVQEALTNVARHAGARSATVRLWGDAERLTIQVTDRGAGFDPVAAASKMTSGLSGMSERATALGGEMTIDTAPGKGTRLLATLPLVAG